METTDPKGGKMGQIFLQDNRISMSTKVRDVEFGMQTFH